MTFSSFPDSDPALSEVSNQRALKVLRRVREKLTGFDFSTKTAVDVPTQVRFLIEQATSNENLCQNYIGWYAYHPHTSLSHPTVYTVITITVFFFAFRCPFW